MRRPSVAAVLVGLLPFAAICLSVHWWDRTEPTVFGIPFNFFWLTLWMLLTPLCMWRAYRIESGRPPQNDDQEGGAQ